MESEILSWFENTWIGTTARETAWVFPAMESIHFMGLCVLVGALAVIDLRVIGMVRRFPIAPLLSLIPLAIVGFSLNLLTGIVLFSADPFRYWPNWAFKLKMLLIVIAGINALWFQFMEHKKMQAIGPGQQAGLPAKFVAAVSLLIWVFVIVLGRFLPYLE